MTGATLQLFRQLINRDVGDRSAEFIPLERKLPERM